jgi:prolipoprotein diacylglyceryltransferase
VTVFPNIDPVAVRWYGLMYLVAFGVFPLPAKQRLQPPCFPVPARRGRMEHLELPCGAKGMGRSG